MQTFFINFDYYQFIVLILIFSLGLRHGLDLDHLAIINLFTKNRENNNQSAKMTGFFFSFGHGLMIQLFILLLSQQLNFNKTTFWLEPFGKYISISFLLVFGLSNIMSKPLSLRGDFFSFLNKIPKSNTSIFLIGAAFALSFDTLTQVLLFKCVSMTTSLSFFYGLIFTCGMITADNLDSWIMAVILHYTKKKYTTCRQFLDISLSSLSIIAGVWELATLFGK